MNYRKTTFTFNWYEISTNFNFFSQKVLVDPNISRVFFWASWSIPSLILKWKKLATIVPHVDLFLSPARSALSIWIFLMPKVSFNVSFRMSSVDTHDSFSYSAILTYLRLSRHEGSLNSLKGMTGGSWKGPFCPSVRLHRRFPEIGLLVFHKFGHGVRSPYGVVFSSARFSVKNLYPQKRGQWAK